MKLKPIKHPAIGRLVPDKWGDSLMAFCEVPGLENFAPTNANESLSELEESDRKLVENWRDVPEALVKNCRNSDIFVSLRALGVVEVEFAKTPSGEPSPEQVSGWQHFRANIETISNNATNALLRYYQVVRATDESWFEDNDCPELHSVEELGRLAMLDGVTFTKLSCDGMSVLWFRWKVDWDMEHGLSMAVWKDQVIGIGMEDLFELSDPMVAQYAQWNRSHMTQPEQECLDRVLAAIGNVSSEEDEGYEDDDE